MMLKTATVKSVGLPTTSSNVFLCNCSSSRMSSSRSAPSVQTTSSASIDTNTTLTKNELMNLGLGMRYEFDLAPVPLRIGSLSCYDDRDENNDNHNNYNFYPNSNFNTNTLTKLKKNDVDESSFVVNIPKSKVSIKKGPGFDSIRKKDGCWIKPCHYNKYTSCVIDNTPDEVINGLVTICDHYGGPANAAGAASVFEDNDNNNNNNNDNNNSSINTFSREIEYRVNKENFIIDGIVFVNHKPIKFVISIWHDSKDMDVFSPVRVEFQKIRGDSNLFHLFWCEMLELMFTFVKNNKLLFGKISDCTRAGKSCLETFLLPLPLPPFPIAPIINEVSNSKFVEININDHDESEENRQDPDVMNQMNQDLAPNGNIDHGNQDNEYKKETLNDDITDHDTGDDDDDDDDDILMHDDYCNDYLDNDKIGGMNIDWSGEYEYSQGDLDDMELDLVEDYRDESLDVLANICNTLETNFQFHKLFCQHNKILKTIADDIINRKNYNNIAKLRGGLCVLLKLIDKNKKSGKSNRSNHELTKQKNSIQETTKKSEKLEKKTTTNTTAVATPTATHNDVNSQPDKDTPSKITLGVNLGYFGFGSNDGNGILTKTKETSNKYSLKTSNCHSAIASNDNMSDEIESVIKYLVNETNLLKQFPLLLENSSQIIENHTIRLINLMFDYIPEKLKMNKTATL